MEFGSNDDGEEEVPTLEVFHSKDTGQVPIPIKSPEPTGQPLALKASTDPWGLHLV